MNHFFCPKCHNAHLNITDQATCPACGAVFTIKQGVVDFINDITDSQESIQQTVDGFGWQWNNTRYGHTKGSIGYGKELFYSRYPVDESQMEAYLKDKIVLDPAVGSGRVEHVFGHLPAHIYANDLSSAVYSATQNLSALTNISYSRGDIFNLPFADETFDAVVCHAILQHTGNAYEALKALASKTKKDGVLFFDLYRRAVPPRDFCDDFIRDQISDLPPRVAYEKLLPLTRLGESIANANITITVPEDIDFLGIEAGEYDLQRFLYYKLLKMYWHPEMSFEENHVVNFDWYYPKLSERYTPEEIRSWTHSLGLHIAHFMATEGGIGVIAIKR